MKQALSILLSFLVLATTAQTTKYKFTIRYEDYGPLKNEIILINSNAVNTDNFGNVEVDIQSNALVAAIASPDINKYRIRFPASSHAILPKSGSVIIDIFVEKPFSKNLAYKGLTKEDLIAQQKALERYQQTQDAQLVKSIKEFHNRLYDSLNVLLRTSANEEIKIKAGRLEFFPEISKALNHYLNEARDLNDAFRILSISMNKKEAYQQLADAIYSYNEIFELINSTKSAYEQAIETYWNSKELSLKFSNLIEFSLEEIHKALILEINSTFTERFYNYTAETKSSKKKALGEQLKRDVEEHAEKLERRLNSMGERITALISILNNISQNK